MGQQDAALAYFQDHFQRQLAVEVAVSRYPVYRRLQHLFHEARILGAVPQVNDVVHRTGELVRLQGPCIVAVAVRNYQ